MVGSSHMISRQWRSQIYQQAVSSNNKSVKRNTMVTNLWFRLETHCIFSKNKKKDKDKDKGEDKKNSCPNS